MSELNAGGSRWANSHSRVELSLALGRVLLPRGVGARQQLHEVGVDEARVLEQRRPQPQALLELGARQQPVDVQRAEPAAQRLLEIADDQRREVVARPARVSRPSRLRRWLAPRVVCARPASARSVKPSTVSGCSWRAPARQRLVGQQIRVEPRRQIALLAGDDPLVVEARVPRRSRRKPNVRSRVGGEAQEGLAVLDLDDARRAAVSLDPRRQDLPHGGEVARIQPFAAARSSRTPRCRG